MRDTNETTKKQFRYNETKERLILVNRIYFIAMNVLYGMFAVYLLLRWVMGSINNIIAQTFLVNGNQPLSIPNRQRVKKHFLAIRVFLIFFKAAVIRLR